MNLSGVESADELSNYIKALFSRIFHFKQLIDKYLITTYTAWKESIKKRLNKSTFVYKSAKRGKYTVRVSCIVDKNGNIADVSCEKNP